MALGSTRGACANCGHRVRGLGWEQTPLDWTWDVAEAGCTRGHGLAPRYPAAVIGGVAPANRLHDHQRSVGPLQDWAEQVTPERQNADSLRISEDPVGAGGELDEGKGCRGHQGLGRNVAGGKPWRARGLACGGALGSGGPLVVATAVHTPPKVPDGPAAEVPSY